MPCYQLVGLAVPPVGMLVGGQEFRALGPVEVNIGWNGHRVWAMRSQKQILNWEESCSAKFTTSDHEVGRYKSANKPWLCDHKSSKMIVGGCTEVSTWLMRVPKKWVSKSRGDCERIKFQANKSMHRMKHEIHLCAIDLMNSDLKVFCGGVSLKMRYKWQRHSTCFHMHPRMKGGFLMIGSRRQSHQWIEEAIWDSCVAIDR